ncbi:MAG: penicillin-binding protein 2 [Candidatus Nealsonbacteria bacterium]
MKKWRVNFIFIILILFGAAILGRLIFIQIIQYDLYKALAQGQQKTFESTKGDRGKIFFRGGEILATNTKRKYVFVSPSEIKEKEKIAEELSQILNIDKDELLKKIEKDNLFEEIKIDLSEKEYNDLKDIELNGVYVSESIAREYPQKSLGGHIVGFLGGEDEGQYGIEGYYDDYLRGKESFKEIERGFGKYFFGNDEESNEGKDIFLTIDYNIQFMAEKLLKKAKQDLDIESGQIIVIDPNSGSIMALADYPGFNPNEYSEVEDLEVFQNSAIQKLFEPGSVFKPMTMASALDQGKITPETTYYDKGTVKAGGSSIFNYDERSYGQQTMTGVLEKSINTGVVFAERQLGNELFLKYLNNFGFFQKTGIDLQGEIFSENEEFKKGYEINFITASFGQGIEITPIQLVRAFSSIANGGKLIDPHVNKNFIQDDIASDNIVISKKTSSDLTAMLVSVVENGFAKKAGIPGYYIAGKTGTAQVALSALGISKKGYSNKTWQSFIGFAPAFNAKFLILVKLDNPKANTAEYSALPIFRELAKYTIDYLEIPPDYEVE